MAIGKVNAYATVDAPKADFGAVAQMNIDNLVKSVKEDEQAKAAKKAAADKAKAERVTEDLPALIATGNYSHDEFLTGDIIKQRKFYENFKTDWRENDNYQSKVAAERIVSNIKNLNNQLTIEAETIKRTSALAGGDKLNKAYADKVMGLTQKERRYTQNEKGEAFTGFYKDNGDGTATLEDEYAYSDYMVMMSNPVMKVDIPTVMGEEAKTFEKTLTETSGSYTLKKGVKKLSDKGLASIDAMAKGKMEDSDFVFNYMIEKGYTPDKNAFARKFDPKLKNELAGMYAEEIKGRIGEERTVDRKEGWHGFAPNGGSGKATEYGEPAVINTTGGVNFGNLEVDSKGNEHLVHDYSKNSSSDLATGLLNKNNKPIMEGSVDLYKGGKVLETVSNARVLDAVYDKRGKLVVKYEFARSKATTMSKPEQDKLADAIRSLEAAGASPEAIQKANDELELSKQTSGEQREVYVQAVGPGQESRLAKGLKGATLNGYLIRNGDVSELKRALRFDPKKVQGTVKKGEVKGRTVLEKGKSFNYKDYYNQQKSKK